MRVKLVNAPEGSPNFCFGLYDDDTGEEINFIQSDHEYLPLAELLGCTTIPSEENASYSDRLSQAYDWLNDNDGEVFEIDYTVVD